MKRKMMLVAVLALAVVLFTGCYHGILTSEIEILNKEGKGVKTFTVEVLHNDTIVPSGAYGDDEPFSPDNNFKKEDGESGVLKVTGNELRDKIKAYCELPDAEITVEDGASSLFIRMKVSFNTVAEYNAKMKTLAGKYADKFVDATISVSGETVTFSEATSNTMYSVMEILENIYNDDTIFDIDVAGGAASVKPYADVGFIYPGTEDDEEPAVLGPGIAHPYAMVQIKSVTVKVGNGSYTEKLSAYEGEQLEYPNYMISASGSFGSAPVKAGCNGFSDGVGSGFAVIVISVLLCGAVLLKRRLA